MVRGRRRVRGVGDGMEGRAGPRADRGSSSDSTADPRHLVLVGYRGCGKSSIGRLAADRAGLRFVDADEELERRSGRTIGEIFATEGEGAFRDLESEILGVLLRDSPPVLIATGGGAVLRSENRELMRRLGFVVWLTASPGELRRRLEISQRRGNPSRPALTALGTLGEIEGVLAARAPLYNETAHVILSTEGRPSETVALEIARHWQQRRPWSGDAGSESGPASESGSESGSGSDSVPGSESRAEMEG